MSADYRHTDDSGDTLQFTGGNQYVLVESDPYVSIPNTDTPTVAAELLKAAGQESVIVPKAYEEVERLGDELTCGGGPEWAGSSIAANPNWLRNKAANCIAIAEYIEGAAAREAAEKAEAEAAEENLRGRRNALAREIAEGVMGARVDYAVMPTTQRRAIDRIIELEDKLASRD